MTLLALIVVLGVLVFVHELGHFMAAKWAGIYVHRFSIGLGAPIRALTFRRGETEYSISWLPLGGYVKMASEEEAGGSAALEGGAVEAEVPADRTFESKPVWKRMVVILAGVTMNVLFAYIVFTGLALANGERLDPTTRVGRVERELVPEEARAAVEGLRAGDRIVRVGAVPVASWNDVMEQVAGAPAQRLPIVLERGDSVVIPIHPDALEERIRLAQAILPYRAPVIGQVVSGQPGERGGLQVGDTIVALGGRPISQWYDLLDVMERNRGEGLEVVVARAGQRRSLDVTPRLDTVPGIDGKPRPMGRIGIGVQIDLEERPYAFGEALAAGAQATWSTTTQIWRSVKGLVSGRISGKQLGGPILIGQLAGESARMGIEPFLGFMALISVNLAVLNMLPVPVLDGGQFLFLLAEAVIRRPLPIRLRERLTAVGLLLIGALMIFAFWNDLRRLFEG